MTSGLVHLAGRVWLYPHDPDPDNVQGGIGVVADERGSVVVDAGNSPCLARRVRDAMEAAGLPAARWLVYTHHHWDHVWGAIAWGDVEVVAHRWYVDAHSAPVSADGVAAFLDEARATDG